MAESSEQEGSGGVGPHPVPQSPMPTWIFGVAVAYLIVLFGIFCLYELSDSFRDALPSSIGPLPVGVPFFGALGGLLISLDGIFRHSEDWQPSFRYWYCLRPIVGAIMGTLGCLFYLVTLKLGNTSATNVNPSAFAVVAFLTGYAEQAFRQLIKRATDVLLGPGKPDDPHLPTEERGR